MHHFHVRLRKSSLQLSSFAALQSPDTHNPHPSLPQSQIFPPRIFDPLKTSTLETSRTA